MANNIIPVPVVVDPVSSESEGHGLRVAGDMRFDQGLAFNENNGSWYTVALSATLVTYPVTYMFPAGIYLVTLHTLQKPTSGIAHAFVENIRTSGTVIVNQETIYSSSSYTIPSGERCLISIVSNGSNWRLRHSATSRACSFRIFKLR